MHMHVIILSQSIESANNHRYSLPLYVPNFLVDSLCDMNLQVINGEVQITNGGAAILVTCNHNYYFSDGGTSKILSRLTCSMLLDFIDRGEQCLSC